MKVEFLIDEFCGARQLFGVVRFADLLKIVEADRNPPAHPN